MAPNVLQFHGAEDYETFEDRHASVPEAVRADLLVRVDSQGRLEDHFRVAVRGNKPLKAAARLDKVMGPNFRGYVLHVEAVPNDIRCKANTFTTKWEELIDVVASGRFGVTHNDQPGDEEFRRAWDQAAKSDQPAKAAVRWTIQAHPRYGFKLLPATTRELRSAARRCVDNAAGIELASWVAEAQMAEAGLWTGPNPLFFAEDPAAARAALEGHPDRLMAGKLDSPVQENWC